MKYVTSIERRGRVEGRTEALRTAALEFLEARFGEIPYALRQELQALGNETDPFDTLLFNFSFQHFSVSAFQLSAFVFAAFLGP